MVSIVHLGALSLSLFRNALECFRTFLAQVLLKDDCVACVAFVYSICNVANKGDKPDEKVDDYIDYHHRAQARWETAIDFFTCPHNHHRKCCVAGIANAIEET